MSNIKLAPAPVQPTLGASDRVPSQKHPMNEHTNHVYQEVMRGLAEEWPQFDALDKSLTTIVADLRGIERESGSPPPEAETQWAQIEILLSEILDHAARTRSRIAGPGEITEDGLADWKPISLLENKVESLLAARKEGAQVKPEARADWETCWLALENDFAMLRAHTKSVLVKLELRRRFGQAKAAEMTAELMEKLPEDLRDAEGTEAFNAAVSQLHEESEQFQGFWDVVKSLALWVETPEERARKLRGSD
jgi:hypothetical protein